MGQRSKDNNQNIVPITIGASAIILVLLSSTSLLGDFNENFSSGFGFEMPPTNQCIFLNLRKQNLSKDFKLMDFVQNLKYKIFKPLTNRSGNMCPVIIVPGLGESSIIAKWSKPGSKNVETIAKSNPNFEQHTKWSCREIQDKWTSLWYSTNSENALIDKYCWEDNVRVVYNHDNMTLENSPGVVTTIKDFGKIPGYMYTLTDALKSIGYNESTGTSGADSYAGSLFGAGYDFRTICGQSQLVNYSVSLKNMIELSVRQNRKKAVLLGHGLGCNIINFFLVNQPQEWKDKYIESFVSYSGAYGGCPQALRTVLSGFNDNNTDGSQITHKAIKDFTGLQWMLPSPYVYKEPLVYFNNVSYGSEDIPSLLEGDTLEIYKNVVLPIQTIGLQAPKVKVYAFGGINKMTESSYMYKDSLSNSPLKVNPMYNTFQEYNNNKTFPEQLNGDGIIPLQSLEVPLKWTTQQSQPIHYRFYDGAEHLEILSLNEPVRELVQLLQTASGF